MERIPSLDGLRAVAIGLVLWLHACYAGYLPSPKWFPYSGRLGVSLFFVLSGFLITSLLLRETSLKNFYVRRILRIFPPLYVFLAFLLVAPYLGWATATEPKSLLASATFTMNLFPSFRDANVQHCWSLSYEEQFYLLWPLVLRLPGSKWIALAFAFGWPVLKFLKHGGTPVPLPIALQSTTFDSLMMGSALALWRPSWRGGSLSVAVMAFLVWALYGFGKWIPGSLLYFVPTVRDVLLAGIVWSASASATNTVGRILNWKPIVWIGWMSYSLYIWHMPFLHNRLSGWQAAICIAAASSLSYFALERPLMRWRSKLRPESDSRTPPSPEAAASPA